MKTLIRITEPFHEGRTIEKQIAIAMLTNEPVDQSSPITFTKRSDGVLPDFDISTFDTASRADKPLRSSFRQLFPISHRTTSFYLWYEFNIVFSPCQGISEKKTKKSFFGVSKRIPYQEGYAFS